MYVNQNRRLLSFFFRLLRDRRTTISPYSSTVELQSCKLLMGVQFPLRAIVGLNKRVSRQKEIKIVRQEGNHDSHVSHHGDNGKDLALCCRPARYR